MLPHTSLALLHVANCYMPLFKEIEKVVIPYLVSIPSQQAPQVCNVMLKYVGNVSQEMGDILIPKLSKLALSDQTSQEVQVFGFFPLREMVQILSNFRIRISLIQKTLLGPFIEADMHRFMELFTIEDANFDDKLVEFTSIVFKCFEHEPHAMSSNIEELMAYAQTLQLLKDTSAAPTILCSVVMYHQPVADSKEVNQLIDVPKILQSPNRTHQLYCFACLACRFPHHYASVFFALYMNTDSKIKNSLHMDTLFHHAICTALTMDPHLIVPMQHQLVPLCNWLLRFDTYANLKIMSRTCQAFAAMKRVLNANALQNSELAEILPMISYYERSTSLFSANALPNFRSADILFVFAKK